MTWNNLKTPFKLLVVVAITVLSLWLMLPVQSKIHLGLDLQGGSRLLLQLTPAAGSEAIPPSQLQEQTRQVIDRRINALGVTEPQITTVGSTRLLVELPNVKNPDEAEKVIKQVAVLDFKIVPPQVVQTAEADLEILKAPSATAKQKADAEKYVAQTAYQLSGPVVYSGKDLKGAQSAMNQQGGSALVQFQTKDAAAFGKVTTTNLGKALGIFLDKRYISAPTIQGAIYGDGQITGQFTQDDTILLANELNSGALPANVTIIEKESIGPTLGAIDLRQSLIAAMIGLLVVVVFMIVAYRLPGFLADVALMIYILMMLGLLSLSGATLTLPGIAGFVLSIGMAVDANVLIFERIKEELWNGKSLRAAVRVGFTRAFSAVFDSHFTTIVGAGVLYSLGTGTVKGFAFTLFWGTVLSLVTAVFITRFFVDVLVDNGIATKPELYGVKSSEVGIFAKSGQGA
jgi:preprotein translocase subunit SecD